MLPALRMFSSNEIYYPPKELKFTSGAHTIYRCREELLKNRFELWVMRPGQGVLTAYLLYSLLKFKWLHAFGTAVFLAPLFSMTGRMRMNQAALIKTIELMESG